MHPALPRGQVEALLSNWQRLNAELLTLSCSGVLYLLEQEVVGAKRPHFILRLFGRYNRLRYTEQRDQLLRGEVPWQTPEWHARQREENDQ